MGAAIQLIMTLIELVQYVAVAHAVTPFISAYPWSKGGFLSKFSDPATLPVNEGLSATFSTANDVLAVGNISTTPFIQAYPWSVTGFGTKFTDPSAPPPGNGRGISFTTADDAIVIAHSALPFVTA